VIEQTMRAIEAILEADPTIPRDERSAVLAFCQNPQAPATRQQPNRPEFVTAQEAADILKTSKRTVWRLVKMGKIRRIKLGHRCTRFRLDDVAGITSVEERDQPWS